MARKPARKDSDKKSLGCRVVWTTTIDRPDLRGPTYPQVPAGTKFQSQRFSENCKAAAAMYKELVDGVWDGVGDYVSSASVVRVWKDENRRHGTVKPWVSRSRLAGTRPRKCK